MTRSYQGLRDDPFALLGLLPPIEDAALKAAWRRKAKETHPDLVQGAAAKLEATEKFKRVLWAYEVLSNPESREYFTRMHGSSERGGPEHRAATEQTQAESAQRAEEYAEMSLDDLLEASALAATFVGMFAVGGLFILAKGAHKAVRFVGDEVADIFDAGEYNKKLKEWTLIRDAMEYEAMSKLWPDKRPRFWGILFGIVALPYFLCGIAYCAALLIQLWKYDADSETWWFWPMAIIALCSLGNGASGVAYFLLIISLLQFADIVPLLDGGTHPEVMFLVTAALCVLSVADGRLMRRAHYSSAELKEAGFDPPPRPKRTRKNRDAWGNFIG